MSDRQAGQGYLCVEPGGREERSRKATSKKVVNRTVAAGSGLRQVMKPHQGLARAATCQLWPQTELFSLSHGRLVLPLPASPHSSLSRRGAIGYLTNGSDMYP